MSCTNWERWHQLEESLLEHQRQVAKPDGAEQEMLEELHECWGRLMPEEQAELERQASVRLELLTKMRDAAAGTAPEVAPTSPPPPTWPSQGKCR